MTFITAIETVDVRFPTSLSLDGSDEMNQDPDYSTYYVILKTNYPQGLEGHGLTFTFGRGNDICILALEALGILLVKKPVETWVEDMVGFRRMITSDSQLRWLGLEKGVIHLATGAVVNTVWDLYAKMSGKPLWRLLAEMSPEEIVGCIDFMYLTDALTPEEALEILQKWGFTKQQCIAEMKATGYPAYTTSAGWLGYSDDKIRRLCQEAVAESWTHLKMKVGAHLQDDLRRAAIIPEEIGYDRKLMMDANQKWDVPQAIECVQTLQQFQPWWIEEPTSLDDALGHRKIREAIFPIKLATEEYCQNRLIFKLLLQGEAIDFCQIDSCRIGGVNEILAVPLMAAKFGAPLCPHAGA